MTFIDLWSFEIGYMLAHMLRTIAYEIVAKPIISTELLQFECRLTQLKEEIRSISVSVILSIIEESFHEFLVLCSQND